MAFCPHCGATRAAEARYCGNCGRPADEAPFAAAAPAPAGYVAPPALSPPPPMAAAYPQPTPTSGKAITSLIVGIVGACLSWMPFVNFVALVLAVVAIVLGASARRDIDADPRIQGSGLAIAGVVLGIIAGAVSLLWTAFIITTGF